MTDKTVLVLGAVGVGAILLLLVSKKNQQQLARQQLVIGGQYANTTAGQVGGILSSVGSFFNSGALQSLHDSFFDSGPNNEPGLVPASAAAPGSNDPGLNFPGNYQITTGPMQEDIYG
jgi:hypothetical protein